MHELFKAIFADAQVLDLNFSNWDRTVQLCVVGLDVEDPVPEQLRLFAIDFARVNDFHCRFRHLDTELYAPEHHFQWNIHDFKIEQEDRLLVIELVGSGVSPMLSITCERYEIRPLAHEVLDRLFPKWRKPFGPLVRPGIEEMAFRQKQRRKR